MNIFEELRTRVRRGSFQPGLLNVVFSSDYIIRRGLFRSIRSLASSISGNVLDFGCGSKPYESLFSAADDYLGVDIEVSGHSHHESKVDVFYDGKKLPFADAQFDAVVSFEVFEHVFNLSDVLLEINRVTKTGGNLLISIPFAWNEHEIPYDFARYTSFGIVHILKDAGYQIVEVRKTTSYLLAVMQMFIAYLTQITPLNRMIRYPVQVAVIFPCTVLAYALDAVLPERHEYYCNTVVLARKLAASAVQT